MEVKICLVLGAGASLANGLHFRSKRMKDTLPPLDTSFFETVDRRKIRLGGWLRRYLTEVLSLDLSTTTLREQPMEQVFADVFYDFNEAKGTRGRKVSRSCAARSGERQRSRSQQLWSPSCRGHVAWRESGVNR